MRAVLWTLLTVLVLFAGFAAWAARPSIHPIEAPTVDAFDPNEIDRGANLAAIGNCNVCHTAQGGRAFAGGRAVPTPFGIVYSTNITPDLMTGIGQWSERAFARAMKEGVDRDGQHLYPAFPYDHFTLLSDADIRALYAYMMTRESVRADPPANTVPFPLSVRPVLAAWKALFFAPEPFRPDSRQSAVWNRGAYLVEGVGHCGACHTPRNFLGAEKTRQALDGGEVQGWNAYALDENSPAPVPWTTESLFNYLSRGWHTEHGVARGPMADVTANLATVQQSDVRAIATYIVAQMQAKAPKPPKRVNETDKGHALGAAVYQSTCAACHSGSRPLPYGGIDFAMSSAISAPNPRNIINVTLHGLHPPEGERGSVMPGFAGAIDDRQLEALLGFLRSEFSNQPPWEGVRADIEAAREAEIEEGGSWP